MALDDEIEFMLETAGLYLEKKPTRADVLSVFAGIRPLVKSGEGGNTAAATVAGVLGLLDSTPPVREALRSVLGRDRAQLLLGGVTVASLTLSGSPLGLLVSGAGALSLDALIRRRS